MAEYHNNLPTAREEYRGVKLGFWLNTQRQCHRKRTLALERVHALNAIHPEWFSGIKKTGLEKFTREYLRHFCQINGLSSTGTKAKLIEKLQGINFEAPNGFTLPLPDNNDYDNWTLAQLKDKCKQVGVSGRGKKAELAQRIREKDQPQIVYIQL